jgi:hypothetical protein
LALKFGDGENFMTRFLKFISATAIFGISLTAAHSQLNYVFSQAGGFPGPYGTITVPHGANLTQIVGDYTEPGVDAQGYVQTGTKFVSAQPPGVKSSYLFTINQSGVAIGGFCENGCNLGSGQHGYTYDSANGSIKTIDYPQAGSTTGNGINNKGQIVGGFCTSTIDCPVLGGSIADHGFLDSNGVFTQLDYPGAQSTQAMAINDAGAIAGAYFINLSGPHGFLYQNGTYTNIDYPGSSYTVPTSMNNAGIVAGLMSDSTGIHGFLYQNGKFEKVSDPTSPNDTEMTGINDHNDVVGIVSTPKAVLTFKGIPKK